jgi:alpha-tubulin suppressor-like RCC1 family protein
MAGYTVLVTRLRVRLPTAVPAGRPAFAPAFALQLAVLTLVALSACKQELEPGDARDDSGVSAGDAGPEPDAARKAPAPTPPAAGDDDGGLDVGCQSNAECSDGLVCNGSERCVLGACAAGEPPACPPEHACSEAAQGCDCSVPDADEDGVPAAVCAGPNDGRDCNDGDRGIYPGNVEQCDDGDVDEDCKPESYGPRDGDGDGEDDFRCCNVAADGERHCGSDCDDSAYNVNRGVTETCDGIDNDCDGYRDELPGSQLNDSLFGRFYRDADGDSQGNPNDTLHACVQPEGYASEPGDCRDDGQPQRFTGATEQCDGVDDDCDQIVDEAVTLPALPRTQLECRGEQGVVITACERDSADRLTYDDCNADVQDGCETPVTTLRDCRACGRSCHFACGNSDCNEITALAAGNVNTCAITREGAAACWGENGHGQIGDDTTPQTAVARKVVVLSDVRAIAIGDRHACASDGPERALYCWGDNSHSQLGVFVGPPTSPVPIRVEGRITALLGGVDALAAGALHTCAVVGGEVLCWGQGLDGRLGDGDTAEHEVHRPSYVVSAASGQPVRDAKAVAAGAQHSCLLTQAGAVECWGDNTWGQLGRGVAGSALANAASSAPVVALDSVEAIAAGLRHTCALRAGAVYCWGANGYGQLGGATLTTAGAARTSDPIPTQVPGLTGIAKLAAGIELSCALDAAGTLSCWGGSRFGELGVVDDALHGVTPIAIDPVAAVTAGGGQVCARLVAGPVYCWGLDSSGQLGTGTPAKSPQPLPQKLHWLYGSEP